MLGTSNQTILMLDKPANKICSLLPLTRKDITAPVPDGALCAWEGGQPSKGPGASTDSLHSSVTQIQASVFILSNGNSQADL